MVHTRLPLQSAITLIAVMIFNCGVAVAEPNQTSARLHYAWLSGCSLTNDFFQGWRVRTRGFAYELLSGDRHMCSRGHDCSASHRYGRSVHRRTAHEDSRGLQPFCR